MVVDAGGFSCPRSMARSRRATKRRSICSSRSRGQSPCCSSPGSGLPIVDTWRSGEPGRLLVAGVIDRVVGVRRGRRHQHAPRGGCCSASWPEKVPLCSTSGGAVAQGTGLAGNHRHIMPGVVDRLTATQCQLAGMSCQFLRPRYVPGCSAVAGITSVKQVAYLGASARRPGLWSVGRHRCRADLRWPTETRLHGWPS
jgi:hypothetical protein